MRIKLLFTIIFLSTQLTFSQWTQLGSDIDGEAAGDQSGISNSLSADGNRIAIGAYFNDDNGSNSGHVRVFEFDGLNWNQLGQDIDGEATIDYFGFSVSISDNGNIVAIGALRNDGNGVDSGHVRIYEFDGVAWNQLGQSINGEAAGDLSGRSISLSGDGNIVAIGATGNGVDGSGHARVYQFNGATWNQIGQDIDGEAAGDGFGYTVSLSNDGNNVAITAIGNDGNGNSSGHVRIYQFDGLNWNQLGQDIDGEAAGNFSGISVNLNSDGTVVAIGASYNNGNGNQSGHARIYQFDGVTWNQLGIDIDGEAAVDRSGISVSLSSDGSNVAIGANLNSGGGYRSGHVRVYTNALLSNPYTAIPDANFEAALDALGYDDIPGDNQVPTANIEGITNLDVNSQNIADLTGIEDFTALESLLCYNNQLTSLDVTQNPNLITLWTAINQLTDLDVTQNPNITDLRCFNNQLTTLDVSQNPNLIELYCYDNQLTTLEFTQNPNLLYAYCNTNALATIDISQNLNLITLACHENLLTSLDASQNPNLTGLYSHNNPLLSCIQVANATDADAGVGIYTGWSRDGATTYSENCGVMGRSTNVSKTKDTEDANETEASFTASTIILYPNPVKDDLHIALPAKSELINIVVYNLKGERVAQSKNTTITLTSLASGIYFAEIQLSDKESIFKKIVVARD